MWQKKQKWSYEPRGRSAIHPQGERYERRTKTVVILRHNVRERERDISTGNNLLRFAGLIGELSNRR